MAQRGTTYLPHVDGLRAIAILSVVAYHAVPRFVPGGFIGVDVFFVISGFLITSIIAHEISASKFSIIGFLARRARRIVPALIAVYLASFAAAFFLLLPDTMRDFGRSLLSSALFGANYFFHKNTDYFSPPAHEKPLLHTWSLSIEEQFYIIWPLILMALAAWLPRRIVPAAIAVLALASLAFAEVKVQQGLQYAGAETIRIQTYAFYMLTCRAWELLLGAVLALMVRQLRPPQRIADGMALTGLACIIASAVFLTSTTPFPGVTALPATLGTAAIILACHHYPTMAGRALSVRPLVWTGLISYSLYLWHWPVLAFARVGLPVKMSYPVIGVLVTMSFALAWASWRYIERPFRAREGHFYRPDRRAVVTALSVLFISASLGLAIRLGDGWYWRHDALTQQVFIERASSNPYRRSCDSTEKVFGTDKECTFGAAKAPSHSFDIAIFGDSNADQFVPLVADYSESHGLSGRQVTQNTCAPLLGVWNKTQPDWRLEQCLAYQHQILRFVEQNPELKLAVLAANWASYQGANALGHNGIALESSGVTPSTRSPGSVSLKQHLQTTVEYFRKRNVKVVLIGQIPYFADLPFKCAVAARRQGKTGPECGIPARAVIQALSVSNSAIREIAARDGQVFSLLPTDVMCDDEHCYAVMDSVFFYRDHGHLNATAARHLEKYFQLPKLP